MRGAAAAPPPPRPPPRPRLVLPASAPLTPAAPAPLPPTLSLPPAPPRAPLAAAVRNDASSHNIATLAAHVATRLPRAFYFSSTDVDLTLNAVVLLRVLVKFLISHASAAELSAHLALSPNVGRAPTLPVAGLDFAALVAALLDFVASAPVSQELYELHVQVLTLMLVLLSTQLIEPDVLSAASLVSGEAPGSSSDPALALAMAAGRAAAGSGPASLDAAAPAGK